MENKDIINNINELKTVGGNRTAKYRRNFRRYNYTPFASIENIRNPSVIGYFQTDASIENDTTATPQMNVDRI